MDIHFSGGVLVKKMTEPMYIGDARQGYASFQASLKLQEEADNQAETLEAAGTEAESVVYSQPNPDDDQLVDTFYLVATEGDALSVREAKETVSNLEKQDPINRKAVKQASAKLKELAKQIYELALGDQT